MTTAQQISPCKSCGKIPRVFVYMPAPMWTEYFIECCGVLTDPESDSSESEAIANWNYLQAGGK